jgi:hypothetical protein
MVHTGRRILLRQTFFKPLHASHLIEKLPEVVRFLGLPPGSRFLLAGEHVDGISLENCGRAEPGSAAGARVHLRALA